MAARAAQNIHRIITREGSPSIVTLEAVIAGRCQVLADGDIPNLPALRRAVDDIVTLGAADTAMIAVREDSPEIVLRHGRPPVWRDRMADVAASDIALGSMACVAVAVRIDARRNGLSRPRRRMAECAAGSRPSLSTFVSNVVELHIKALAKLCGERPHGRIGGIEPRVTYRAHGAVLRVYLVRDELAQMTADTGFMAGKLEFALFALATMAGDAIKALVLAHGVIELCEGRIGYLGCHRRKRF